MARARLAPSWPEVPVGAAGAAWLAPVIALAVALVTALVSAPLLAFGAAPGTEVAAPDAARSERLSERVVVGGAVKTALTLTVDDLEAFPADQIVSTTVTRRSAGGETASTVRGVKLTAVLERAGLASREENDWKHAVVLATATDGYRVVFSWPELFNTEVGRGALVVFERDGQPLGEREGRIALVSAGDVRTGPRSVKWLARLDVSVLR